MIGLEGIITHQPLVFVIESGALQDRKSALKRNLGCDAMPQIVDYEGSLGSRGWRLEHLGQPRIVDKRPFFV